MFFGAQLSILFGTREIIGYMVVRLMILLSSSILYVRGFVPVLDRGERMLIYLFNLLFYLISCLFPGCGVLFLFVMLYFPSRWDLVEFVVFVLLFF